ncbi:MAG: MutS-related protein [Terriglobales bacterium]
MTTSPLTEYTRRAADRTTEASRLDRRSALLGNIKLAAVIAFFVAGAFYVKQHSFSPYWLLIPVISFAVLVVVHDRVIKAKQRAEKTGAYYRRGLARIEDRWSGAGDPGEEFRSPDHVYAEDLDLFGRGSLFELLCTARTPVGRQTLANWLLAAAPAEEVRARQQSIDELRSRLDFREDLAITGGDLPSPRRPEWLVEWGESPIALQGPALRVLAALLALAAVATLVYGGLHRDWVPLLLVVAATSFIANRLRHRVHLVLDAFSAAADELALVSALMARIEREPFTTAWLRARAAGLASSSMTPSRSLARLRQLADLANGTHNLFVKLIDIPLLYSVQVAFAAESWRRKHGRSVGQWLRAMGDVEALVSLSAYAFEHPSDPFPEFVPERVPGLFDAEQIGHPLLPAAGCVRNRVCLGNPTQLLLVSGSNMSGKSTLMRAIGVNAVLAQAGAPVRAARLTMSPVRLGTSIRVTDSLQAGRSGFYAEIVCLRQVMSLTEGGKPVLFLLDELLHGTNSHDRKIGAEGILRALLERRAIGIATTHDLALTAIANTAPDGRVRNAHFEDHVEDGRMRFDYILRDGIVTKSNALELMRSIGLDV